MQLLVGHVYRRRCGIRQAVWFRNAHAALALHQCCLLNVPMVKGLNQPEG
jgi:hypothetical protein